MALIQVIPDFNNMIGGVGKAVASSANSVVQPTMASISNTLGLPQSPPGLSATDITNPVGASAKEMRVRLTALNPSAVFGSGNSGLSSAIITPIPGLQPSSNSGSGSIMSILQEQQVNGIIFPYTPQVSFSQAVNYADLQLVHSNTDYPAYTRTPSVSVQVTAKFTVQNQREGQYALAALHFLRTTSKSHFGENDSTPGLPPPVLLLNGYGDYIFHDVRVILKNHSWAWDDTVDYTTVTSGSVVVRLPVLFSVQCELMVVQTPQRMRQKFSFQAFASGKLLNDGGWI